MESLKLISVASSSGNYTSNFTHLYKIRPTKEDSQAIRRQKLLEQQKKFRNNLQDSSRILLLAQCEDEEECKPKRKSKNVSTKNVSAGSISKQLMFSEWMEELPENFENDWLMVLCPVGMRVLIVASRGRTKVITKRGRCLWEFQSALPGGNNAFSQIFKSAYTILDCIYSETTETFYILDLLAWGNQSFTNCETEFRIFWLQGKLLEYPELGLRNIRSNLYPFTLLPYFTCSKESISNALTNWPFFNDNSPKVDGLLFYHKNAAYTAGFSPTVLWLLPFMVQEVICSDAIVNDKYLKERPIDYKGQKVFIHTFNEEHKKKKYKKEHSHSIMMEMQIMNDNSTFTANTEMDVEHN